LRARDHDPAGDSIDYLLTRFTPEDEPKAVAGDRADRPDLETTI
jgi:hypothetical protein